MPVGLGDGGAHDQPVAVLDQRMPHVHQLRRLPVAFAAQTEATYSRHGTISDGKRPAAQLFEGIRQRIGVD